MSGGRPRMAGVRPLLAGLLVLTGCAFDGRPAAGGSATAPVLAPTASAAPVGATRPDGMPLPSALPAAFPFPPGASVQAAADDGRQISILLAVPSAAGAEAFYRSALPAAGYAVQEQGTETVGGLVTGRGQRFSSAEFEGQLAVSESGAPHVAIQLTRPGRHGRG